MGKIWKDLVLKLGVKKLTIIGAILVIAIVGTVVGVSALKPVNEVVEEVKNKDEDSDTDKEKAETKIEETETSEDVTQETVAEEETAEEQTETTEDTTSATTGNTNSNSTTNNTTTNTTPSNSTSSNNTNNNNSASQNTQTQTTTTPTVYYEKYNLKFSSLSTNVCFNTEAGHTCGRHKTITIEQENLVDSGLFEIYKEMISMDGTDVTKYNRVCFKTYNGWFDEDYSDCHFDSGAPFYAFDKYTGTIFNAYNDWVQITYNGKTYKISYIPDGMGGGGTEQSVCCPKDYDGLVFVMMAENDMNREIINDGKIHTIDEVIDFENDKYYLFSAGN